MIKTLADLGKTVPSIVLALERYADNEAYERKCTNPFSSAFVLIASFYREDKRYWLYRRIN